MFARSLVTVFVALLLPGCVPSNEGEGSQRPTSSPGVTSSPVALCTVPPPDFESIYESLDGVDPLDCYGGAELTFDAYWSGGPGGAIDCPHVEPGWLSCESTILISPPLGESRIRLAATTGDEEKPMWVAIHPDARLGEDPWSWQGNATLTAHFDDPAALECHYEVEGGIYDLTNEEAIAGCRRTMVVTELQLIEGRVERRKEVDS